MAWACAGVDAARTDYTERLRAYMEKVVREAKLHGSWLRPSEEYERAMSASESDRRARSAFQQLVLSIAPAGAALYDFGAGTGIDARFYAEHGFTVGAYDVDPAMREHFAIGDEYRRREASAYHAPIPQEAKA